MIRKEYRIDIILNAQSLEWELGMIRVYPGVPVCSNDFPDFEILQFRGALSGPLLGTPLVQSCHERRTGKSEAGETQLACRRQSRLPDDNRCLGCHAPPDGT